MARSICIRSRWLVPLLGFLLFCLVPLRAGFAQDTLPAFELPDTTGTVQRLQDYRGKIVILNF